MCKANSLISSIFVVSIKFIIMKSKSNVIGSLILSTLLLLSFSLEINSQNMRGCKKSTCKSSCKNMQQSIVQKDSVRTNPCGFAGTVSEKEAQGLQYMFEEEKMARDVYTYLHEKYEMRVFGNIKQSEQMHMSAIAGLMEGAEITNKGSEEAGTFSIQEIQDLYDELIKKGDKSVKDALEVGVLIEETDIKDLEDEIASAENESIKQVYTNLLAASNRHIQAFNRNLERR